uniref:ubiquitinyl hydrolase 1 n=1 Tax=Steinernema glaseri TaxID=37863 RepID=A0A1I7YQ44_9BILA
MRQLNTTNKLGTQGELAKAYGSLIHQMWSGQHSFVVPHEFKARIKFDHFCFLSLSLPAISPSENNVDISKCFDLFTREEKLGEDNLSSCSQCKEKRQCSKKLDLWKLPDTLIVHLKRFQYTSSNTCEKLNYPVKFPVRGFDLTDRVLEKSGKEYVYDLIAISDHSGGLEGGHYTAVGLNNGKWYKFDDSSASELGDLPDEMPSRGAYMLFYQRRDTLESNAPRKCDGNGPATNEAASTNGATDVGTSSESENTIQIVINVYTTVGFVM